MFNVSIIPKEDLDSIVPLLEMLNPEIEKEIIAQRLNEIKSKTDYQCVGVYDKSKLIAISGIWILHKIYAGKHIEPDNVIVHPDYRRKGVGEILMNWIHDYAKENGCLTSELNARVTNAAGNKFWINQGYEIAGYHFIKKITDGKSSNACLGESEKEIINH